MRQACLDIVTRIARNEGGFDAVQGYDRGLVSIGVQQWTLMGNDEMTVLLTGRASSTRSITTC